ncbi:hypothetical protein [Maricaulis sp.]|uniref:hypothetical protein n=1 Tax=Maricaulis sp. TaxID=1486257 RepID=UPI002617B007|nr:hypothetical protein [Maricaulis sp.]
MKLFSPIVLFVALGVAGLSVALLVLDPANWGRALLSLVFLPVGGAVIYQISRRNTGAAGRQRSLIRVRAAMVGAGAVLASALGFRLIEVLGVETDTTAKFVASMVLVLVVVLGEFQSGRMDSRADKIDDD